MKLHIMKDYSSRNTLEGNLIKIENLYKSIFTEVGNTSIELTNRIVSIHHEDSTNIDAASLELSEKEDGYTICLLYTSPSPRDVEESRMPSSA